MSIKNNILNNFLSTATAGALAVGGLASVALAPIAVEAANGTLEIRADNLTDSTFYHVCRYNLSTSDLDPDNDGTDVVLSNVGTTLNLAKSSITDPESATTSNLKTKVSDTPDAEGEYQIMSNGDVVYYSESGSASLVTGATTIVTLPTNATPNFNNPAEAAAVDVDAVTKWHLDGTNLTVWDSAGTTTVSDVEKITLAQGDYFTDKDGTTFINDGTNVFSIDLDKGENANSDDNDNAPLTEDSEFRVDNSTKDALLVLLELGGPESTIESAINSDSNVYCEYENSGTSQKYHPFRNLQGGTAEAILMDGETFNDDEDDFETLVSTSGFSAIKKLQAGQSDTPGETTNETLQVSKGDKEQIDEDMLKFEADGATSSQIIYTIVSTPKYGSIIYDRGNGQKDTLVKDSQFSQQNINNGDIEYKHNGDNEEDDEFTFKVYNADKEPYSDYTTSVKTMEIEIGNTDSDFNTCGTFELKAGQDQGDRVIMSEGVVKICDSKQDDNADIKYTIKSDANTETPTDKLGKGEYVVVYKDNNNDGDYDDGEEVSSFTLEEVEDGDIVVELLQTAPDNINSETMSLDIEDGESDEDAKGVTLKFTFQDNTDPFVVNNTLNLGGVNQSATITEDDLKVGDGDDNYLDLELEVTSSPAFGILKKDGAPLSMGSTFEMEDIVDAKISYENTLDTSLDTVGFKATDPSGDNTGFTFRINVTGGTAPNDCDFSDVPSSQTFNKEICGLKKKGVVNGYPDGSYGPNNNVTRGEMAKFVVKAFNMSPDTSNCENFSDAMGNTFENEIKMLKCSGVVGGNNGRYLPNDSITRGEAMKLIVKGAEFKGLKMDMTTTSGFSDVPMDQTFYNEIYKAYSNGIANGQNGNFFPERNITRGEMSKIVYNSHLMLVEKNLF